MPVFLFFKKRKWKIKKYGCFFPCLCESLFEKEPPVHSFFLFAFEQNGNFEAFEAGAARGGRNPSYWNSPLAVLFPFLPSIHTFCLLFTFFPSFLPPTPSFAFSGKTSHSLEFFEWTHNFPHISQLLPSSNSKCLLCILKMAPDPTALQQLKVYLMSKAVKVLGEECIFFLFHSRFLGCASPTPLSSMLETSRSSRTKGSNY